MNLRLKLSELATSCLEDDAARTAPRIEWKAWPLESKHESCVDFLIYNLPVRGEAIRCSSSTLALLIIHINLYLLLLFVKFFPTTQFPGYYTPGKQNLILFDKLTTITDYSLWGITWDNYLLWSFPGYWQGFSEGGIW